VLLAAAQHLVSSVTYRQFGDMAHVMVARKWGLVLAWSLGNGGWVTKVALWDFDETLAERPGRWWAACSRSSGDAILS
jgi:hypothetical protein